MKNRSGFVLHEKYPFKLNVKLEVVGCSLKFVFGWTCRASTSDFL